MKFSKFLESAKSLDGLFNYNDAHDAVTEMLEKDYPNSDVMSIYEDKNDIHYTLSEIIEDKVVSYLIHRVTLESDTYMIEHIDTLNNLEEAKSTLNAFANLWRYGLKL